MNTRAKEFIKSCHLPGPSSTINGIINKIINDPNTPHAKLTRIMSMDPVLTAKVIRLANTSLNRGKSETGCLSKAITKVGLAQIRTMFKAKTDFIEFPPELEELMTPKDFWERSLAVGICSQIIDRCLGNNSDDIFYAGLLHDYGLMIILNNADKLPVAKLKRRCSDDDILVYKSERKYYGFSHMEAADALFSDWQMPAVIREAAAFHHSPILAVRCRYETAVVHVADIICRALCIGKTVDATIPILDMDTVNWLGLKETLLDSICEETIHQLEDRMNLLEHMHASS